VAKTKSRKPDRLKLLAMSCLRTAWVVCRRHRAEIPAEVRQLLLAGLVETCKSHLAAAAGGGDAVDRVIAGIREDDEAELVAALASILGEDSVRDAYQRLFGAEEASR
jgi:hypothetical protein